MSDETRNGKTQTIPVIDLSAFLREGRDQEKCIKEIGEGFQKVGFIAVENHGISDELIRAAYGKAEEFFLLSDAIKSRYEVVVDGEPRGFSAMGREHVKNESTPDLKEFWHTGRETLEDGRAQTAYPGNVWPIEVKGFQQTMLRLYDELELVACYILEAAAMYLGLPRYFMCDRITDGNTVLRLAHYPPVPNGTSPSVFRAAPHEDIDFITLLCEATGDGLEILQKDGSWLPIRALRGQIVVNAGDMLQNLTNGVYKSTTHRVTNNNLDRSRRLSMPFFVHPRGEIDLSPLETCLQQTGANARFRPIGARAYYEERLTEIGFGNNVTRSQPRPVA